VKLIRAAAALLLLSGLFLAGYGLLQPAKALLGQLLLERSFVAGGTRPWPGADMRPVAKIKIERLGISRLVVNRASGEGMAWAPGIVAGTTEPGSGSLSIIAGHRDSHMAFLGDVRIDDVITLDTLEQRGLKYTVSGAMVVDSSRWRPHIALEGQERLYLTTCWPLGGHTDTSKRMVVMALRD